MKSKQNTLRIPLLGVLLYIPILHNSRNVLLSIRDSGSYIHYTTSKPNRKECKHNEVGDKGVWVESAINIASWLVTTMCTATKSTHHHHSAHPAASDHTQQHIYHTSPLLPAWAKTIPLADSSNQQNMPLNCWISAMPFMHPNPLHPLQAPLLSPLPVGPLSHNRSSFDHPCAPHPCKWTTHFSMCYSTRTIPQPTSLHSVHSMPPSSRSATPPLHMSCPYHFTSRLFHCYYPCSIKPHTHCRTCTHHSLQLLIPPLPAPTLVHTPLHCHCNVCAHSHWYLVSL